MQAEEHTENLSEINTSLETENPLKLNHPTNKVSLDSVPEHLIQNEIFAYLTSNDLFFNGRAVSTSWSEMVKNVWGNKIKEEMIDQVKSIDFIYEKEVLTKTYEFKLNYLINYKNLLTAYNNNANILTIIYHLVQHLGDAEVKRLIIHFFSFINLQFALEYVQENQFETLKNYLLNDDNHVYFKIKILELMIIEDNLKDIAYLNDSKANFALLNKEHLENISDFAKLIYSFLQGMIEYQILKVEVRELKEKIENLLKKLQETSKIWPKKKRFLEKAYKLIIFNKNSTWKIRGIITKFEQSKIRHPLIDFNDECIRSILEVRKFLVTNQVKLQTPVVNSEGVLVEMENPIDEKIFENICQRRILLTKKLLILERFSELYEKCVVLKKKEVNENNEVCDNVDNEFIVLGNRLTLKEFLWSMKISANSQEENVTEESLLRTKLHLDKNFDYENHIIYTIPRRMRKANEEYEASKAAKEELTIDSHNSNSNNCDSCITSALRTHKINANGDGDQDNEDKEIFASLENELDKYEFLLRLSKNYSDKTQQEESNESNECYKVYCESCVNRNKNNNQNSNDNNLEGETNNNDGFNRNNLRISSMPFVPIRPRADNTCSRLINENNNNFNNQNRQIDKKELHELQELQELEYVNENANKLEEEEITNENHKKFFENLRKQGILLQENEEEDQVENQSYSNNNTSTNANINNNSNLNSHNRPPAYGYNVKNQNTLNQNNTGNSNNNLISIYNNQNFSSSNNNNNFNFRDAELEEEVKQAENIVDQLHSSSGRRPNSEDLISVLESKEAEVNRLRIEKDKLVLRKQKTEQVLEMLKKFLILKDNMSKNKCYYKVISYLLTRMKNSESNNSSDIAYLSLIINSGELDQIISNANFDAFFESSNETQDEIESFRNLDELIKEIENDLLRQVNEIFGEHATENSN